MSQKDIAALTKAIQAGWDDPDDLLDTKAKRYVSQPTFRRGPLILGNIQR